METVKNIDISVNLGKFKLQNPVLTASGTYGYANEFDVFCDVKNIGAIVTKGITLEPRPGNEGERIFETTGGMINRIGLENVGIDAFIKDKLPELQKCEINFIMNMGASTQEEYVQIAKKAQNAQIPAIEMNVSCPNVKSGCLEFGTGPKCLYELTSRVREVYDGFLCVKLTPNTSDIESLAISVEKAKADCISAINTLKGLGVKLDIANGKVKKTFVQGGLSGRCIKPVALSMVKRIKEVSGLPVIGIGGIATLDDMLEFFAVGAEAVQIGTQNFINPDVAETIAVELYEFMRDNGFNNLEDLKKELRK